MYAKFSLILSLIFTLNLNAQVKWMTIEEALQAQKNVPKKILIDFYADWCKPCREMDAKTYGNPVISKIINDEFYPVKFNAEDKNPVNIFGRTFTNSDAEKGKTKHALNDFTKFMSVNSVPALVFIDEQAMPITILNGGLTAAEVEPYLTAISKNLYQKISTKEQWETFRKKFHSKLKD